MLALYDQTITVYRQCLKTLSAMLDKAEAHEKGASLLEAKLADDMHPLATQIRFVGNLPGEALERLSDRTFTPREENATSFAEAKQVLAEMDDYLGAVEAGELRAILLGVKMIQQIRDGSAIQNGECLQIFLFLRHRLRKENPPQFVDDLTLVHRRQF